MNIAKRSRLAVSAALVVAGAGIAAHVASSSGQSSNEAVAVLRPLDGATLPPGVLTAARASARAANIPPAAIDEAGVSAAGSPFRSTLIARRRGEMLLAFAAPDLVTSFRPVASALRGHRMLVLEGTGGTASSLREVGLSIVVERSIARVEVVDVDGGTVQLALTKSGRSLRLGLGQRNRARRLPEDRPRLQRRRDHGRRAFRRSKAGALLSRHGACFPPRWQAPCGSARGQRCRG
jgi:hypothetical protein